MGRSVELWSLPARSRCADRYPGIFSLIASGPQRTSDLHFQPAHYECVIPSGKWWQEITVNGTTKFLSCTPI